MYNQHVYRTNHKYKMANNEIVSKINRFDYDVHIVNPIQLTVQT